MQANGWRGVEPKITKQISGLEGGKCYNRNTDYGNTEERKE